MFTVECPRDAMQGIETFIPTDAKVAYLNQLLQVGFDVLDFGSFVSAKAVPQLRDTAEVARRLDLGNSSTELLAIVGNERGAQEAMEFDIIRHLGFPFGVSEEFQRRNLGTTKEASWTLVQQLLDRCATGNKHLVVYLSMAFGNPYGEEWSEERIAEDVGRLAELGVDWISLSDTVGIAPPERIGGFFSRVRQAFPDLELGVHLHARPENTHAKLQAAWDAGCRRFDAAMLGLGGCPFAEDELLGNISTEKLLSFAEVVQARHTVEIHRFQYAHNKALDTFPTHGN
ncbi:hydroxymethylglutaryl-CoA lyase [bacterium]|nr:hydroxymethylglutaryl-CoA lyase [bacterium]